MPNICINPIPVMTYRLLRTAALALLLAYGSIAQAAPKDKPAPKAAASKSTPAKTPAKSDKSNKNQPKEKSKSKADPIGKIIKDKQKPSDSRNNKKAESQKRDSKHETKREAKATTKHESKPKWQRPPLPPAKNPNPTSSQWGAPMPTNSSPTPWALSA